MKETIKLLLSQIGENPSRPGLIDTPARIEKMFHEIFRGYLTDPPDITIFSNGEDGIFYDEMIMDSGKFYSMCEHHMMPFFGTYHFAYIPSPNGAVLGLSKVARVVDYFSARLQIQERLTRDICRHIETGLSPVGDEIEVSLGRKLNLIPPPLGVALVIRAEHLCKTMRGVKKEGVMTTSYLTGVFKTDEKVRQEFLTMAL